MSKKLPTQKEFLENAMRDLGMSRTQFASRIATPIKTLSKWLTDPTKKDFRNMPGMAWQFITEILEREGPRTKDRK